MGGILIYMEHMARRQIDIRFKGPGIGPNTVRAKDLGTVLVALDNAVHAMGRHLDLALPDSAGLCITGIRDGSLVMRLQNTSDLGVFRAFDGFASAIHVGEVGDAPQEVFQAGEVMGTFCAAYNCRAELRGKASRRKPDVVIYPLNPAVVAPRVERIKGVTTVRGMIERAGGATPKAWLRLHYGLIPVIVTKEQAIELGGVLYRKVVLQGKAEWDRATREIQSLELQEIVKVCADVSPDDAFEALSREFGHLFDDSREIAT